jgi:hypothetical protein
MRRLTLAAAAAALLLPAAHAGAIDPELYAARFCLLRLQGTSLRDSIRQAVEYARDSQAPSPTATVTLHGETVRIDGAAAMDAASKRCTEV